VSFNTTRSAQPRSSEERERILAAPGFGLHFTDHMVEVRWDKDTGWHDAVVRPYGPLQLDPAAAVLHYGQEIFEGIKAYRHADGSIWTFRPDANGRRLQRSAQRLALPELPVEIFVESLKQLIAVDASWVPSADESSLYFRPFMIGDEAFLGVARISPRAWRRWRSGCPPSTRAQARAVPARPSAVATTPPRCCHSRRRRRRVARRCCSWIRSKASTWKNWVA